MNREEILREIDDTMAELRDVKAKVNEALSHARNIVARNGDDVAGYNKGLEDAWELVRELYYKGNITTKDIREIYDIKTNNHTEFGTVIREFTPQEALAKLEAYEKEQAEINVGDEITVLGNAIKGYVIDESKECENCYVVLITNYKDLHTAIYNKTVISKTGKHIDISSILKQIYKKGEDGK